MAKNQVIVPVPIGTVLADLLDSLVGPLSEAFGLPCRVAASIPTSPKAYDQRRGQYVGSKVLAALGQLDSTNAERILGIIDADCHAPGLNFIFGQASISGCNAFIALPRLRPSFYGMPENDALFRERVLKEAVHELGHTYGLGHCPNPRCVMHFSNSLYDTDVKDARFCHHCTQVQGMTSATGTMTGKVESGTMAAQSDFHRSVECKASFAPQR
jgi:archaemetzincin